jgi:hypothetical protein
VRDVLALIRCGNRIYEVTTATLGPLPLDQLPKSKPVTPYAVSLIVLTSRPYAKRPSRSRPRVDNEKRLASAGGGRRRARRRLTGRVGAGLNGPGLPRDEARFSSRQLGRNPPSGRPASLIKTSERCGKVALSHNSFA